MALRNAFEAIALESTANTSLVDQLTMQRELLTNILTELKVMNIHMTLITNHEVNVEDLDLEDN